MPAPRDSFQIMRKVVSKFDPRRAGPGPGTEVFARARPETVRVTERYYYEQEISHNSENGAAEDPTGQLEIVVPFDGADHFTREACDDVAAALLRQSPDEAVSALIGHVVFAGHQETDLADRLGLDDSYGSFPIRVPVSGRGSPGGVEELSTDRHACFISHDYTPTPPELIPIGVSAHLLDPDTISDIHAFSMSGTDTADLSKLSQQPNFQSFLWLVIQVRVVLPWKKEENDEQNPSRPAVERRPPRPVVERVSIDWPSITSLHALSLVFPDRGADPVPITYNPVDRSIEWRNVPMRKDTPAKGRKDELVFVTEPMVLKIEQPGELYEQKNLDGRVEVKLPGFLVSGTRSRLFDGTGRMDERDGDEQEDTRHQGDRKGHKEVSWITSRFRLVLYDAFARRPLRPHQHLHFDDVIPDEARIADIENALRTRGFTVHFGAKQLNGKKQQWEGTADRSEGPERMKLRLFVEGMMYDTERRVHRGGQSQKKILASGEILLFISGELPGTSQAITREMNALHAIIWERFARAR
ncbi:hypothetical protein ACFQ05_37410 [Amycolatopsis umgeniensis]|uniref:Uncharacterized protein n=1 Tax=Amycolatopsis umgeniensis TaxID=336628 RepID=A0A841AXV9_9PSEU|nr:hypothetical protein [Amycolatopsis umgeniensis]MBB5851104.1 hypothetical protein [Amycolatopsis umgeniensis]